MASQLGPMDAYKIVVIGATGAGKSCLILQVARQYYDKTIEDTYKKLITVDDRACLVEILDTAWDREDTPNMLARSWISESSAAVIAYSIAQEDTFKVVPSLIENVRAIMPRTAITIVGTQADLLERSVSFKAGADLAATNSCSFFEASAKTSENVDALFADVVRALRVSRDPDVGGRGLLCNGCVVA
ncbi:ras family protein [Exidia glandulosa HHB12029]|uniref:Ras family protein n=1 Tax=Exidia glandulosa HHB12029 TaxID=1314781 RepID=A0A165DR73_EXIGL|nr:ras family protein [Exidia glandulosa HHB12029]